MATVTPRAGAGNTSNLSAYAAAAFTPAVDDLIVVMASVSGSTEAGGATFSCSDNQGGSYYLADLQVKANNADTLLAFVRTSKVSSAVSHTVTVSCTGDPGTGAIVTVVTVAGMSKTGSAAVRQTGSATGTTSPAPAVTMAVGAALTDNPILAYLSNATNPATMTAPTNFTEQYDVGYATPTQGGHLVTRDSGHTSATVTWGGNSGSAWAAIAIELDASADDKTDSDSATVSETAGQTAQVLDSAAASETATIMVLAGDTATMTESASRSSQVLDSAVATDLAGKTSQVLDSAAATEVVTIRTSAAADQAAASEIAHLAAQALEIASATDAASVDAGAEPKSGADSVVATESVGLEIQVLEQATATDAISAIVKQVLEQATATDTINARSLQAIEQGSAADVVLAAARQVLEQAAATELAGRDGLARDSSTASETAGLARVLPTAESASAAESSLLVATLARADTAIATESAVVSGKNEPGTIQTTGRSGSISSQLDPSSADVQVSGSEASIATTTRNGKISHG